MAEPRTALVTGANRGLGLEVSRQLAQRGYRVILTARDGAAARAAAESSKDSGQIVGEQLDVTDRKSVAALAGRIGPLAALVNNAGISMTGFDVGVVRGTLGVNFHGALAVTEALAPLVESGGNIVMVSSGMGELHAYAPAIRARFLDPALTIDGLKGLVAEFEQGVAAGNHEEHGWPSSAYRVSKAALNALTRIWNRDDARVRVNAVCPGWVKTDMGGPSASRTVEQGARGIVWAATLADDGPRGGFFRDSKPIPW